MSFSASSRADLRSPEFHPGWPQQVWVAGTATSQPASSRSFSAAKPIDGRIRSTRQVTNRPTRMAARAEIGRGRLYQALRGYHAVHAKELLRVGPDLLGRQPRTLAQLLELGDRVLAGDFRVDSLPWSEIEALPCDVHDLCVKALQMHFHPPQDRIVERLMTE